MKRISTMRFACIALGITFLNASLGFSPQTIQAIQNGSSSRQAKCEEHHDSLISHSRYKSSLCMAFEFRSDPQSPLPSPELSSSDVVTLCMDALQYQPPNQALETCFHFSSDRCRAAVGGTLEAFIQYADNPVFGTLVNCDSYEILSIGPIIPPSSQGLGSRRGEMQTYLVEITEGMTIKTVLQEAKNVPGKRKRPTIEERLRRRALEENASGPSQKTSKDPDFVIVEEDLEAGKRRFLWTLQKEVRPPRQDCWLVHEVLFTQNALHSTY